jgi:hypothetical protein
VFCGPRFRRIQCERVRAVRAFATGQTLVQGELRLRSKRAHLAEPHFAYASVLMSVASFQVHAGFLRHYDQSVAIALSRPSYLLLRCLLTTFEREVLEQLLLGLDDGIAFLDRRLCRFPRR